MLCVFCLVLSLIDYEKILFLNIKLCLFPTLYIKDGTITRLGCRPWACLLCSPPESLVSLWWHCLFPEFLGSCKAITSATCSHFNRQSKTTEAQTLEKHLKNPQKDGIWPFIQLNSVWWLLRDFLHRKERGIFKQENWWGIHVDVTFGSQKKLLKLTSIRFSSSVDKTRLFKGSWELKSLRVPVNTTTFNVQNLMLRPMTLR